MESVWRLRALCEAVVVVEEVTRDWKSRDWEGLHTVLTLNSVFFWKLTG